MKYVDFASKISFYEFLQKEFKAPHFRTDKYKKEIELLSGNVNIEYLTNILSSNPKVIDIFEELFQLQRFTNAQYVNFCFDVQVLNNCDEELIINYIKNRVFKFDNGKVNENFKALYDKVAENKVANDKETIFSVKRAIVGYVEKCLKKREVLYSHLENSIDARLRVSKYLIENLNAKDYLSSINLEEFLAYKRHPVDTKSLHGNFGIAKIVKILEDAGFVNHDNSVRGRVLTVGDASLCKAVKNEFAYLRERSIDGINKRKDRKPKVFDFVLLHNGSPRIFIETNFYTTSGTKIGINQGEYVDLLEDVSEFRTKNNVECIFIWVTDGNYWLTGDGEQRFENLKKNYFTSELGLLNYNLLKENLSAIKNVMKS